MVALRRHSVVSPFGMLRTSCAARVRAFSLIEMTLVMATIAVLAAIGIPRYAEATSRYRVDLAAKRIVADLALARTTGRATGLGQVVNFSTPTNGYTLPGLSGQDSRTTNYVVDLSAEPYRSTITRVAFGSATPAATSVRFTRFGTPEMGGVIVISSGRYSKAVALDPVTGTAEVVQ